MKTVAVKLNKRVPVYMGEKADNGSDGKNSVAVAVSNGFSRKKKKSKEARRSRRNNR